MGRIVPAHAQFVPNDGRIVLTYRYEPALGMDDDQNGKKPIVQPNHLLLVNACIGLTPNVAIVPLFEDPRKHYATKDRLYHPVNLLHCRPLLDDIQ
jgi:hypothetical protein